MMYSEGIAYIGPETLSLASLPALLARLDAPPSVVALDTETVSLKDRTCIGVGVALSTEEAIYFRVVPDLSPHIDHLIHVVCNRHILKVYHNAMFDLKVLTDMGDLFGWPSIEEEHIADTSIMARVQALNPSLQMLTLNLIGRYIASYEELIAPLPGQRNKRHALDIPWNEIAFKCLQDCLATYALYMKLW